jgi:hypothetical protein
MISITLRKKNTGPDLIGAKRREASPELIHLTRLFTAIAFSQKKSSNPKIGKNETEISSFIMADDYLAFGVHLAYRVSLLKKLKIGGGLCTEPTTRILNLNFMGMELYSPMQCSFSAVGKNWSFGGQIGHGIYNQEFSSVSYKLKAGLYWSISCNYRAIVSKKMLFTTSLLMGKRNFVISLADLHQVILVL